MPVNPAYDASDSVMVIDESSEARAYLKNYFQALGNETRLNLVSGMLCGKGYEELGEEVDMTRDGVHKNLERLREGELVYRPSKENLQWVPTPLGQYAVEDGEKNLQDILSAYDMLSETEDYLRHVIDDVVSPARELDIIQDKHVERAIHTKKWEQVWDDVEEQLDIETLYYHPHDDFMTGIEDDEREVSNQPEYGGTTGTDLIGVARKSSTREEIIRELYTTDHLRPSELYDALQSRIDTSEENMYQQLSSLTKTGILDKQTVSRRTTMYSLTPEGQDVAEELDLTLTPEQEIQHVIQHSPLSYEDIEAILGDMEKA